MTTIVYRDGWMAADTAVFDRDCYCGESIKVFQSPGGAIGGSAGCLGDLVMFRDWLLAGAASEAIPDFIARDSEGLLASPDGKVEWIGFGKKRIEVVGEFHAIGSGFKIAMGALHAGADATKAVAIAAKLDAHTRAPITIIKVGG